MIIYQSSARYNCKAADKFNSFFLSFSKVLWSVPGKDIRSMSERERRQRLYSIYIRGDFYSFYCKNLADQRHVLTQEQEQEQRTVRAEAYKLPILQAKRIRTSGSNRMTQKKVRSISVQDNIKINTEQLNQTYLIIGISIVCATQSQAKTLMCLV